ncbi:hypothetical protein JY466_08530 [Serratia marcescens]|nr:hypothetical protein [Serratia marcescens]MBN5194676.1 hypothetical protein [Serratia marcescens]
MDNKLSELSKPVFEIEVSCGHWLNCTSGKLTPDASADFSDWPDGVNRLYSQEYVSALLAELEFEKQNNAGVAGMVEDYETKLAEKDKRIAELERSNQAQDDHINQQQDRIDSLEKTNSGLGRRLGDAEKRLATPVRLPKRWDVSGQVNPPRIVEVQFEQQNRTHDQCAEAIRAAGFTVEGGE